MGKSSKRQRRKIRKRQDAEVRKDPTKFTKRWKAKDEAKATLSLDDQTHELLKSPPLEGLARDIVNLLESPKCGGGSLTTAEVQRALRGKHEKFFISDKLDKFHGFLLVRPEFQLFQGQSINQFKEWRVRLTNAKGWKV